MLEAAKRSPPANMQHSRTDINDSLTELEQKNKRYAKYQHLHEEKSDTSINLMKLLIG